MIRKGRFKKPAADIAQRYGEFISSDWRLYAYDIAGSTAHAAANQITHWRAHPGLTDESG